MRKVVIAATKPRAGNTHNVKGGKWDNTDNGKADHDAGGLLKCITGAQLNAVCNHYMKGGTMEQMKNDSKKSLRDAYHNLCEEFPKMSKSEVDKRLKKHWEISSTTAAAKATCKTVIDFLNLMDKKVRKLSQQGYTEFRAWGQEHFGKDLWDNWTWSNGGYEQWWTPKGLKENSKRKTFLDNFSKYSAEIDNKIAEINKKDSVHRKAFKTVDLESFIEGIKSSELKSKFFKKFTIKVKPTKNDRWSNSSKLQNAYSIKIKGVAGNDWVELEGVISADPDWRNTKKTKYNLDMGADYCIDGQEWRGRRGIDCNELSFGESDFREHYKLVNALNSYLALVDASVAKRKDIKDRAISVTFGFGGRSGTWKFLPERIEELKQTLKAGKAINLTPYGMGVGYMVSTKPESSRYSTSGVVTGEAEKIFGVGKLYYSSYDHD